MKIITLKNSCVIIINIYKKCVFKLKIWAWKVFCKIFTSFICTLNQPEAFVCLQNWRRCPSISSMSCPLYNSHWILVHLIWKYWTTTWGRRAFSNIWQYRNSAFNIPVINIPIFNYSKNFRCFGSNFANLKFIYKTF